MAIKYKYSEVNGLFKETIDINLIPQGLEYETIEYTPIPTLSVSTFETTTTNANFRMAFRRVMNASIETIVELIKQMPDSEQKFDFLDLLEYSNTLYRYNTSLIAGATMFELTTEQLDQIFITAENLNY